MTMANTSLAEICENAKLARDMALTGDYDSATIYYEGLQAMLVRMINSISDPLRKGKWTMVCIILEIDGWMDSSSFPSIIAD